MGGKKLSPIEAKAKMNVLEGLKKDMQGMMGDKVSGLKKVTVASPDKSGLKAGLKTAEEMVGENGMELGEDTQDENPLELMGETETMETPHTDEEPKTPEECDVKIQELLMKKEALKKS